jgi:hypothetical protein
MLIYCNTGNSSCTYVPVSQFIHLDEVLKIWAMADLKLAWKSMTKVISLTNSKFHLKYCHVFGVA